MLSLAKHPRSAGTISPGYKGVLIMPRTYWENACRQLGYGSIRGILRFAKDDMGRTYYLSAFSTTLA